MMLAIVFAAVLAGAPPTQVTAYQSAIAHYAEGNVDAASAALDALSHEQIKHEVEAMVRTAITARTDQRTPELARRLETAAVFETDYAMRADLDPDSTFFQLNMAHLLLSFDRELLTETDPDHVRRQEFVSRWVAVAASIMLFDGRDADASPIVEEALKLAPADARLLFWRARILEFQAVWARRPNTDLHEVPLPESNRTTAFDLLTAAHLWGPIEAAYRHVIAIDPTASEAHLHLGYALYWQRSFADARGEYELARDRARDPSVVYVANLLLARLDEEQGDAATAAAAYEAAMAVLPGAQSAYIGLSALEMRRGNTARARALTARLTAIPEQARADDPWWSYHGSRLPSDDLAWLRAAVRR